MADPQFDPDDHEDMGSAAWRGLHNGELGPLAEFLKKYPDNVPAVISSQLVRMIMGTKEQSGFRLAIEKHPDLDRRSQGIEKRNRSQSREMKIAAFIHYQGGHKKGQLEAALLEATQKFGLKRAQLMAIWGRRGTFFDGIDDKMLDVFLYSGESNRS